MKFTFLSDDVVKTMKLRLARKSIQTYENQIKRLFKSLFGVNVFSKYILINETDSVINYISNNSDKTSTKKLMTASIIAVLKKNSSSDIIAKYDRLFRILSKKKNDEYLYEVPNEKKLKLWKNISELYSYLKMDVVTLDQLIRYLYLFVPPLRLSEYRHMKLDKGRNHYDRDNKVFIIGRHKTVSSLGHKTIDVPPIVSDLLDKYIKKNNILTEKYLFTTTNGNQYSQPYFTKTFNNIFGKNISVDILRKIYITDMLNYLTNTYKGKELIYKRKKIAHIMGHSLSTQEMIYRGYSLTDVKLSDVNFLDTIWKVSFV